MFIEKLRIQGYKSLDDITLSDLGAINVFHGYNDVGKSNILEAIDLFCQLLPFALDIETEWEGLTAYDLLPYRPGDIFRLQNADLRKPIEWEANMRLSDAATPFDVYMRLERPKASPKVRREFALPDEEQEPPALDLVLEWPGGRPDEAVLQQLRAPRAGFTLLSARRRFQVEHLEEVPESVKTRTRRPEVTAQNLKHALFDAYASLNLNERARFEQLQALLDQHFQVGRLDVGLKRAGEAHLAGREIVARFLRPALNTAIPIENTGSGVRQILLILGQILLNPARVLGIEEPEMNLSPVWQEHLMVVLRDLISPDSGGLDQMFITSHSPVFEFQDSFYKVTYADQATEVERVPLEERDLFFGARQPLGEQRRQRLNSQNQITLYPEVVRDLELTYGDMVYFNKNQAGRWELYTEAEAMGELREAWGDDAD